MFVQKSYLNVILRTTKDLAKYYTSKIEESKIVEYEGKKFIRGSEILRLLDMRMQQASTSKQEKNLRYSEKIYQVIRDSDKAKLLRSEYRENMKDIVKGMKNKRIKKYDLKEDELTGEKLITKTCEFSHIRSYSIFPEYAEDIENGLIVNKTTHKIITKEGIWTIVNKVDTKK